jgi:hypothetical protein
MVYMHLLELRISDATFKGRKHYTIWNVPDVVDFDYKFTYFLVGGEVPAHDASILPKEIRVDLMGYVSMKVSSTLKMFDMHVDQGRIWP